MASVDSVSPPRRVTVPGGKIEDMDITESTSASWPEVETVADRVEQFSSPASNNPSTSPTEERVGGGSPDDILDSLLGSSSPDSSVVFPVERINPAEPDMKATTVEGSSDYFRRSRNPPQKHGFQPTVPRSPNFHGSHHRSSEKSGDGSPSEIQVSLASSVDLLKKGLRSSNDHALDSSEKKPFRATVPKSPNFHGPPHRRRLSGSNIGNSNGEYSLAQSTKRLTEMLRSTDDSPASSSGSPQSLTVPQSPKFRASHNREKPKSMTEKEAEMAEYCKKNQFRARPLMKRRHSTTSSLTQHQHRPTKFEEFKLLSSQRAASSMRPLSTKSREEVDWEECQKTFHAKPAPLFDRPQPKIPSTPPTTQSPFRLSQSNQRRRGHSVDSGNSRSKFRARPVPMSTYEPDSVEGYCDASSRASTVGEAPLLSTSSRSSHRKASSEEYTRRAESVQKEKQELAQQLRIRRHEEELSKAKQKPSPAFPIAPFQLQSDVRHREYQKRRAEQLKRAEEEAMRLTEFHARPLIKSPIRKLAKSVTPTTEAKPFSLASTSRHDAFEIERKRQIMKEEADLKEKRVFKLPSKSREILEKAGRIPGHNMDNRVMGVDKSNMPIWSWKLFFFLVVFRVLNTIMVQSYFDPDEFWQTMEPAYCEAFSSDMGYDCPGFTWEWKRRAPTTASGFLDQSMQGPARTYLSVVPTYVYYKVLQAMGWDTYWMVARGPMVLYAITVAAPIDMAVWYSTRWLKPSQFVSRRDLAGWALFCSLSSWFNGYSIVRTLANCQEAQALVFAIALVSPELLGNVTARYSFARSCLAFFVGGLGVCVRFTSVAAFVPMGILLALRLEETNMRLHYLFVPCALFGLAGLSVGMVTDRVMFGFWTIPFMGNFHFNVVLDYASLYGAHPGHWYFTAAVPALAGLLLPFLGMDLIDTVLGKTCYGKRNLWIVTFSYIAVMSFNDHKEFRYILPVLPIFSMLAAARIRDALNPITSSSRAWLGIFVTANFIALVYLGLIHQSGPISVNRHIVSQVQGLLDEKYTSLTNVTVHYLTGGCHSAPLHSSLHMPGTTFHTWALDCSPDCRADPDKTCEAFAFDHDPIGFIHEAYPACDEASAAEQTQVCLNTGLQAPDYVVTFSKYSEKIRPQLEQMGLHLEARFPHNLNGASYGDATVGADYYKPEFRHFRIAGGFEISLEEIVLYSKFGAN